MLSHVIEHVSDPEGLLVECHRILKKGGVLSVVTPNIESIGSRYFGRSWLHLDPPRHLVIFNCRTLCSLSVKAGFTDVTIRTIIRDAHALFWASYSISKSGTFCMGVQPPSCLKLLMLTLRLMECAFIKVAPDRGEEISLLCIKT